MALYPPAADDSFDIGDDPIRPDDAITKRAAIDSAADNQALPSVVSGA